MEKIIYLKEVGEVVLRKSRRARRVSIRITPAGRVTVTIPFYSGWNTAVRFLEQKKDWVSRTVQKMEKKRPPRPVYREGENPFTRFHKLILTPSKDAETEEVVRGRITEKEALLIYPASWVPENEQLRAIIQEMYIRVLRQEARQYLLPRLRRLAADHGYTYRRVFLKNLKTRWGSCSAAGNINLNIHLMMLPGHLIDYVLLHELAQTRHKNHGPGFWEELQRTTGNARELDRELNKYPVAHDQ